MKVMTNAGWCILLILPVILTSLVLIKRDKHEIRGTFFLKQTWNCYDILLILIFILFFQVCSFSLVCKTTMSFYSLMPYGYIALPIAVGILLYIILRFKYSKSISTLGFSRQNLSSNIITGLKTSLVFETLFIGIPILFNKEELIFNRSVLFFQIKLFHLPCFPLIACIVSFVIFAPIVEESLFRGFMYSPFKKKLGDKGSIFLSSLIWSLGHQNLKSLVSLFVIGVILSHLYKKNQSLIPSIVMHSMNSFLSFGIFVYSMLAKCGILSPPTKSSLIVIPVSLFLIFVVLALISKDRPRDRK